MSRIHSLDGLRALSIILVLLGHAFHLPGFVANTGVRIFFVISGFLITTLLMREDRIRLRAFYVRRFWRIVPPMLALVAAVALFRLVNHYDIFRALTFTVDYDIWHVSKPLGHLWSLSVEEQFYLIWPLLILFLNIRRAETFAITAVCIAPVIRLAEFVTGWRAPGIGWEFHTVADAIAIGCLLAIRRDWINKRLAIGCIIFAGASYPLHLYTIVGISATNILIACLIDRCLRHRSAILNCTPVVFIGQLSYSLYLWQQPLVLKLGPIQAIAASFVCAAISYWVIEQPFIRLGRRLLASNLHAPRQNKGRAVLETGSVHDDMECTPVAS